MAHCSACGSQLGQGAQFCSGCGRPVTALAVPDPPKKRHPILWAVLVIALLGAIVRVPSVLDSDSSRTTTAAAIADQKQLPAEDRPYVTASIRYLKAVYDSGTNMAIILAGASNGTSTLDDCHTALLRALADETKSYSRYEINRGSVPAAFTEVDRQISQNHKKSIAALKTTLSYWQTGDLGAISRGMDAYKAALINTNATLSQMSNAMDNDSR